MTDQDNTNDALARELKTLRNRVAELERADAERRATERALHAESEHQKHLRYLESMERIDRVIRLATELDQMLQSLLNEVLSILDCDRSWLVFPCDPEAALMTVPFECTRPEYPVALAGGEDVTATAESARVLHEALDCEGPIILDPRSGRSLPDAVEPLSVRSQMIMALRPKSGVHQCSHAREWTEEEQRFINDVGHRITDSLTSLLSLRELRESEMRFRSLVEMAPGVVLYLTPEGKIGEFNSEAERIYGRPRKQVLGQRYLDLFIPKDFREAIAADIQKVLRGEPTRNFVNPVQSDDGTEHVLSWNVDRLLDERGSPMHMGGV